jgi:hypothetical protein
LDPDINSNPERRKVENMMPELNSIIQLVAEPPGTLLVSKKRGNIS